VYERLGRIEETERAWNEARARFPDHPYFRTYDPLLADRFARRAAEALGAGDRGTARRLLERALRYHPGRADLWAYLGTERSATGDPRGAIAAWRQSLRLDPSRTSLADSIRAARAPK
jgi:tetratricopeptide (TPR) repeat protein